MFALFSAEGRRRRLAAKTPPGALRDYLVSPLPAVDRDCAEVGFLSLDLETTGLDAGKDEILSMGWVVLEGRRIDLSTAAHRLVRPSVDIPEETAVIHRITDDAAARGEPLKAVLEDLLAALHGRVLLAHHVRIELGFLDAACRRVYGQGLRLPAVDTLRLARERFERKGRVIREGELRLDALRAQYGLPRYRAHDALSDALATAELFLAELAEIDAHRAVPLRRVLQKW